MGSVGSAVGYMGFTELMRERAFVGFGIEGDLAIFNLVR